LLLIVLWIDNNLIIGSKKTVGKTKKDTMERFECKDCRDVEEYVGCKCKIARTKNPLKFTQPVLMQSYNDEVNLPKKSYRMPATVGLVLVARKKEGALSPAMQKNFCSGAGEAMHAMQYSKPETYNAVQDLSCHMHKTMQNHFKAMLHVLKYSLDTAEQGLVLKPNRKWDGSQSHKFVTSGHLDSNYIKEPKDRCSVSGHVVYL
jgi:hypothetical protein